MDKSDQYQYWISVYHFENLWKHVKTIHLYLWFPIGQSNDIQQLCHTPENAPYIYISINQGELTVNHPRGTVCMVKRSPGIFRHQYADDDTDSSTTIISNLYIYILKAEVAVSAVNMKPLELSYPFILVMARFSWVLTLPGCPQSKESRLCPGAGWPTGDL